MLNKQSLFSAKREEAAAPRNPWPGSAPQHSASHTAPGKGTPPAPAPIPPAVEPESATGSRLIVGPDVKLKGAEIRDCDTLVVEGRVEATLDSRLIQIAEQGAFSGKVGIDVAEIRGTFEGELLVRKQLFIHSTGRVSGTIRYGSILIDEGGQVSGDVRALESEATPGTAAVKMEKPEKVERGDKDPKPLAVLAGS